MSIRVMDLVWDRFPGNTTETFVLLSMADWGNDLGRHIYPAVKTIAAKTRITYRHTQRILAKLRREKWIACVAFEQGGRGHTRHYEINLDKLRAQPSQMDKTDDPQNEANNNHLDNKNKLPDGMDQPSKNGVLHRQNDNEIGDQKNDLSQFDAVPQLKRILGSGNIGKGAQGVTLNENKHDTGVTNPDLKTQRVSHLSVKGGTGGTRTIKNRYEDTLLTSFVTEPYLYLNKLHSTALDDQSQNDSPPEKPFATATSCSDAVSLSDKNDDKKKLPRMPYFKPPGTGDQEHVRFEDKNLTDQASHILALLNRYTENKFRFRNPQGAFTAATKQIISLIRDGYGLDEFYAVIDAKTNEWIHEAKTAQWLRPSTLFKKSNFEMYLGQVEV